METSNALELLKERILSSGVIAAIHIFHMHPVMLVADVHAQVLCHVSGSSELKLSFLI